MILYKSRNKRAEFVECKGRLQSGQMQRTVNPSTMSSMVRIHPCPPKNFACWRGSMVEQLTCNQQVEGSIPFASSMLKVPILGTCSDL